MKRAAFASLLVACGPTTFTTGDGGVTPGDAATEGGLMICSPPCTQLAAVDGPVCLEASTTNVFYATDGANPVAGRIDKTSFTPAMASVTVPAADCTLFGGSLLVAMVPGPILPVNTGSMVVGMPWGPAGGMPNKRITSRFLNPPYVAGIRSDGLWGCDAMMLACKGYTSMGSLAAVATDGDAIYYASDGGVFRNGTLPAALVETLVSVAGVTALAVDLNNVIYATGDKIWSVGKAPGSITKQVVDKMTNIRWITLDLGGMYWATTDGIYGSHKDGGSITQYAARQPQPIRIVTDDAYVYWANHAPQAMGGGIFRVKK